MRRVTTELLDDLDQSVLNDESGGTVLFALDNVTYEIDLSFENQNKLREILQTYIAAARVIGATSDQRAKAVSSDLERENIKLIRSWAKMNGYDVADRGRIAVYIKEAYEARK